MTQDRSSGTLAAFAVVTTLFFAWGFITSLVDPLVGAVKGIFTLSDVQAQLSAFAFFIAYGLISFPAAALLSRIRAVPSIITALLLMIGGCLVMLIAVNLALYTLVLLGLFILAAGITVLQVAANPLAAALGNPRLSHFRLTLSQTFNSFGTFVGPIIGASLFLDGVEVKNGAVLTSEIRNRALGGIDTAYFWLCGMIAALAVFFFLGRKVINRAAPSMPSLTGGLSAIIREAMGSRWAVFGGLAIFLYVGAEVSIGTQMALFLNSDAIWGRSDAPFSVPLLGWVMGSNGVHGVSLQEAGKAVAFYWGGAMVGRALGSGLLTRINAARLLAVFSSIACAMCIYIVINEGVSAGFLALAIGLFNSVMFPVIFTLTLERSRASEEATSGLLCTAIVGGAFVPLVVGTVSGMMGYAFALVVPAICYAILFLFALIAYRSRLVATDVAFEAAATD